MPLNCHPASTGPRSSRTCSGACMQAAKAFDGTLTRDAQTLELSHQPTILEDHCYALVYALYGFGFGFGFDSSKRIIAGGEISATIAYGMPTFSRSLIARYGRPARILRA
jgi:hypothetical protein